MLEQKLKLCGGRSRAFRVHAPNNSPLARRVGVSLAEPKPLPDRHPHALNGLQKLVGKPILRLEFIGNDDFSGQSIADTLNLVIDFKGVNDGPQIQNGGAAWENRQISKAENGAGHFRQTRRTVGDNIIILDRQFGQLI